MSVLPDNWQRELALLDQVPHLCAAVLRAAGWYQLRQFGNQPYCAWQHPVHRNGEHWFSLELAWLTQLEKDNEQTVDSR